MKFATKIACSMGLLALAAPALAEEDATVLAFRKTLAAKAESAKVMTIVGKDGWLFPANELRHMSAGPFWGQAAATVSRASRADRKDPLPAIVAYHEACKAAGINLILLPVPAKCTAYPDMIGDFAAPAPAGKGKRLDTAHQEFYKILREKGVTVIDIADDLIAARAAGKKVYCQTDAHWSAAACRIAAEKLAKHIGKPGWLTQAAQVGPRKEEKSFEITGDLVGTLPEGKEVPKEKLSARFVYRSDTDSDVGAAFEDDEKSPILLLSDSHGLVFHVGDDMHVKGAGLADQLIAETGIGIDVIAARGSAATPVRISLYRKAARDATYLAGKKVIIWCFTVRELTETSGWAKIPLKRN